MFSELIVALTSYPQRIMLAKKTIDSIVNQTIKPDRVVLTLSNDEFVDYDIPEFLSSYKQYGLEIIWCEKNLRAHNKYYYVMKKYPDATIITVDDDIIYEKYLIETLVMGNKKFPNMIVAGRAHLILWNGSNIASYDDWGKCAYEFKEKPRMDLIATGVGGVLYPPHILPEETWNISCILKLCPYADDIWLKIMETKNNVPIVVVADHFMGGVIYESNKLGLCLHENAGEGNDRQFNDVREYYGKKEIDKSLKINGYLDKKEYNDYKSKIETNETDNLIEKIKKTDRIAIYGAGVIANRFLNYLYKLGLRDKVKYVLVTNSLKNADKICDIDIVEFSNTIEVDIIIIAVNPCEHKNIEEELINRGYDKQILKISDKINSFIKQE